MSNIVKANNISAHELALVQNDLSKLDVPERLSLYNKTCESIGLNPLTQPFGYIEFRGGKLSLYAKKDATDQLRKLHSVSVTIVSKEIVNDNYVVIARAKDKEGREDEDMGSVSIKGLSGENLGNAMMKAITKAKRRVTLSICGLGMLDETEVEIAPSSRIVEDTNPAAVETKPVERHHPSSPEITLSEAQKVSKPILNYAPTEPVIDLDAYKLKFNFGTFRMGTSFKQLGIADTKKLQTSIMSYCLKQDSEGKDVPGALKEFIELSTKWIETKEGV